MAKMEELPPRLCCGQEGSFAFETASKRHPAIITALIDQFSRALYTVDDAEEKNDIKGLIQRLSCLKYCLWTNKLVEEITDNAPDADIWRKDIALTLQLFGPSATYFGVSWLFEECYLYRRIREAIWLAPTLQMTDPFASQKETAWITSLPQAQAMATWATDASHWPAATCLKAMLHASLWGNRLDLSLFNQMDAGKAELLHDNTSSEFMLADDTDLLLDVLQRHQAPSGKSGTGNRVDIVLDNAGFELFTDLCVADVLVARSCAETVYLHVKDYGWFVSDATEADVHWLLDELCSCKEASLAGLGQRFKEHLNSKAWVIRHHPFWTTWHDFPSMATQAPDLYCDLQGSDLVLLKGDLNYRKLVGDRQWPFDTPLKTAAGGFQPTTLCALRTCKAEVLCGVAQTRTAAAAKSNADWLVSGQYGVVQLLAV